MKIGDEVTHKYPGLVGGETTGILVSISSDNLHGRVSYGNIFTDRSFLLKNLKLSKRYLRNKIINKLIHTI